MRATNICREQLKRMQQVRSDASTVADDGGATEMVDEAYEEEEEEEEENERTLRVHAYTYMHVLHTHTRRQHCTTWLHTYLSRCMPTHTAKERALQRNGSFAAWSCMSISPLLYSCQKQTATAL